MDVPLLNLTLVPELACLKLGMLADTGAATTWALRTFIANAIVIEVNLHKALNQKLRSK